MLTQWLKERLQQPLPGKEAHRRMIPSGRNLDMPVPESARESAVMVLLYELDKQWNTLLIRRTRDGQVHSGQISFPGGKRDPKDSSLLHTALRECEEEIGVRSRDIEIIGSLSPVYIPPSNFLVIPTLGQLRVLPHFRPSEQEVEEIIQIPIDLLFAPHTLKEREVLPSSTPASPLRTPVYEPDPELLVWGATAMMLAELQTLLEEFQQVGPFVPNV